MPEEKYKPEEKYISLKPSEAVQGGGMVPEGRYDITNAMFAMWDYNGTVSPSVPALAVEFKNADGQTFTQYYSAGDHRNMHPSDDKKRLVQAGSVGFLNNSTNCYQFMASVVSGGMPEEKIANDISILVGCNVDIKYEATKEREIRGQKQPAKLIAVISKIHAFPDVAIKAAAKKATASKANGQQLGAVVRTKAIDTLQKILAGTGGQIDKKGIPEKVFNTMLATDTDRSAVLQIIVKEEFLSSLADLGVLYDAANGTVISVEV